MVKKQNKVDSKDIVPEKYVPHSVYTENDSVLKSNLISRLKILVYLILSAFALCAIGIFAILWVWGRELPDFSILKDYEPAISSRIYAGDGKLLAQYAKKRRIFMPIVSIPNKLKHAFIAAEDRNFYSHSGIDTLALARATISNISRVIKGTRVIGASTITQQVAKNFFLNNERTISRKVKEAILAIRIENALSKDKILELYLNEIYLGRGAYGVAAASMRYFNKPPSALNYAQVAYLAVLPKAPSNYHPIRKTKRAIIRRNWVLDRMFEEGYISITDLKHSKQQKLNAMLGKDPATIEANYYLEESRREIYKKFGEAGLYKNGLSIHTTLNSTYQSYAHKALRKALIEYDMRHGYRGAITNLSKSKNPIARFKKINKFAGTGSWIQALVTDLKKKSADIILKDGREIILQFEAVKWARKYYIRKAGSLPKKISDVLKVGDVILLEKTKQSYILRQVPKVNGAMVAIDPHTGRVLAMVGGWDFETSKFNRATQAKRQPGSSIKPFVYLTALNNGETPSTRVLDAPFVLTLENGEKWKPHNFTKKFYGPSILRIGIEKSRNLMTVRLANKIGMKKVLKTFNDFGVMDDPKPYLSYALGAGETTLINLITGYSMIINGGKKITPSLIDRVQNRYGKVIYRHIKQPCKNCSVLSDNMPEITDNRHIITNPISAYQVVTMMEGVIQRGTGKALKEFNIPIAGKTGTTNNGQDAWFIGATPDLIVGTYIGFDKPKSLGQRPPNKTYRWWTQETGASVAVPAVKEFYRQLSSHLPAVPFRIPAGVRMVRIDPNTGGVATSKTKNPQTEAFIPGTEPTSTKGDIISDEVTSKENTKIGIDILY